jgi:glycosyltransferase involved in cell wall biosynthesis
VHGFWAHRQAVATRDAGAEIKVLALRRPVPPLSVARELARAPRDLRPLRRWASDARAAARRFTLDGIDVIPVSWLGPPRPISYGAWGYWMAPALRRALDRLHAEWPFELLHAHCIAPAGHAAAKWILRGPGPAFAISGHGPDMIHVPERSPVGHRAALTALRAADAVLANSRWAARRCQEIAGGELPVHVVHLGADPVSARSGRNGHVRLVTVAHLVQRKRHANVLRALAAVEPRMRPDYLVIGEGPRRRPLERLSRELGLTDRVTFVGQLPNDEAVALIAECDLFVMPSVEEPFGVAYVEAMAAGLPAVGSRGEGGPEDIAAAGEGMVLVEPDDVGGLATTIERLCSDRDRLRRLGEAARTTATSSFSWEACGMRTLAAYREAIAATNASKSRPLTSASTARLS